MKIIILTILALVLLAMPVFSASGFGTNYSIDPSEYIAYDRFNRSDSTNLGNLATGQSWSEHTGDSEILDEAMYLDGAEKTCFDEEFGTAQTTDPYTVDLVYFPSQNVDKTRVMNYYNTAGCGGSVYLQVGSIVGLGDPDDGDFLASVNSGWDIGSPAFDVENMGAGTTKLLIRTHVYPSTDEVNATLFNFSVENGVITLHELSTIGRVSSIGGIAGTSAVMFHHSATGSSTTWHEIAFYNGTTRPARFNPDITPPYVEGDYPDGDEHISENFYVNGTATDNIGLANISVNISGWDAYWYDYTPTTASFRVNNSGASDGNYNMNITINDTSGNVVNHYANFTIDTTLPLIVTVSSPLNNSYTNEDIIIGGLCTDENPYRFNFTFFDGDTQLQSKENRTPTGTELRLNDTVSVSSLVTKQYGLNFTCADEHTDNDLRDYTIVKETNNKKVIFNEDVEIKLKSFDNDYQYSGIGTEKKKDRYTFNFGADVPQGYYTFEITCKDNIYYLADSSYKGHFVCGGYWIDFVNDDPNAVYSVEKANTKKYEIEIYTNSLNFESIGDLNIEEVFLFVNVDKEPPSVTLTSPNGATFSDSVPIAVDFECSATDNYNLQNITLYHNLSNNWTGYATTTISPASLSHTFSDNDTIVWNCYACDVLSNCNFSGTNYSFDVSITGVYTAPVETELEFDECIFLSGSLTKTLGLIFMVVLAFAIMLLGYFFKSGLVGFIGASMLLLTSFYFYTCFAIFALAHSLLSFALMWFFLAKGYDGTL